MRATLLLMIALAAPVAWGAPMGQKTFKTPEAAAQALIKAAQAKDASALIALLGPQGKPLVDSGDPVADKNARDAFLARYKEASYLDKSDPNRVTLEAGNDKWPFPIPMVKQGALWFFDSPAGVQEVVNRRVGANELSTIQSCLAYVDAQQEFYQRNVQKDPLQHYANKLISSDGKKDGLYWPTTAGETPSPLGEGIAAARDEGYMAGGTYQGEPFHGYVYRLLRMQGPAAAGGAYEYVVDGQLLGGFAAIAFPADYGNSGVMSFIVNHDGVVYSRDLGPHTEDVAMGIVEFNPDSTWKKEDGDTVAAK